MALDFPAGLVPEMVLFDIENVSRSGGLSTNGEEQIIVSGVGRWKATLSGIRIRTSDQVLAWRAFKARMRGRSGTVLVPVFDGKRVNWPVDAQGRRLDPGFTRRRQLDGTIYEDPAIPPESNVSVTIGAHARRAVTVTLGVAQGQPLKEGQYFSPAAGKLHIITQSLGSNSYAIEPPLRAATTAGQSVQIVRPTCEMRLAEDSEGALELELLRFGTITLNLVEAF